MSAPQNSAVTAATGPSMTSATSGTPVTRRAGRFSAQIDPLLRSLGSSGRSHPKRVRVQWVLHRERLLGAFRTFGIACPDALINKEARAFVWGLKARYDEPLPDRRNTLTPIRLDDRRLALHAATRRTSQGKEIAGLGGAFKVRGTRVRRQQYQRQLASPEHEELLSACFADDARAFGYPTGRVTAARSNHPP